jgi:hypothetical protein
VWRTFVALLALVWSVSSTAAVTGVCCHLPTSFAGGDSHTSVFGHERHAGHSHNHIAANKPVSTTGINSGHQDDCIDTGLSGNSILYVIVGKIPKKEDKKDPVYLSVHTWPQGPNQKAVSYLQRQYSLYQPKPLYLQFQHFFE